MAQLAQQTERAMDRSERMETLIDDADADLRGPSDSPHIDWKIARRATVVSVDGIGAFDLVRET